ncbi:MAG: FGGY-family carbohydrate kinase [Bacillota bacterium]
MSFLGLDIGTTGCKALLLSSEGEVLSLAYREYPLVYPKLGWAELDPVAVWDAVREVLSEVASRAGSDKVRALSVSSHGESVTPIGSEGIPLYNTITSLDNRTVQFTRLWEEEFGRSRLEGITGIPLHHKHSINRIMWLRRHEPEVYHKTWKFMCYEDFIIYKLGLGPVIDPSLAARTMAYDARRGRWSEEILSFADVDLRLLPDIQASGMPVGVLSERAAEEVGLAKGVLVVAGGHDQPCAALGAGITDSGPSADSIGTAEALIAVLSPSAANHRLLAQGYPCYPHVVPEKTVTISVNPNAGALFRWYRDNIAADERREALAAGKSVYDLIVERCHKQPSEVYVLPHFTGSGTPSPNPRLRGAIVGLGLGTTRHDIAWAILESQAFELRINVTTLKQSGVDISKVVAVGGAAKSLDALRLRADVLGLPVVVPMIREAACLGAAMLAGYGTREYSSLQQAAASLVRVATVLEPDPETARAYDQKFGAYCRIRSTMGELGVEPGSSIGGMDGGL